MNHNNAIDTNNISEREDDLLNTLNELKHICFGMYAKIIPNDINVSRLDLLEHVILGISSELASESVGANSKHSELSFYIAFYQTAIYYLLAMCNECDQILLSLRKLANTFNTELQVPIQETTFYFMIDDVKVDVPNKRERIYAEHCLKYYKEFEKYYTLHMIPFEFRNHVRIGVNRYADAHGLSCIVSENKYLEILGIVKDACNKAYSATYQELEM